MNCGASKIPSLRKQSLIIFSIFFIQFNTNPPYFSGFLTTLATPLFAVTTCGSPTSALQVLTKSKLDAVLTNVFSAVACGFDFRAIVESNLGIPVLYCKHTTIKFCIT